MARAESRRREAVLQRDAGLTQEQLLEKYKNRFWGLALHKIPEELWPERTRDIYHRFKEGRKLAPQIVRKGNWDAQKAELRIESIVNYELDENLSQKEIADKLDVSPRTLMEFKRQHRELLKDAYSKRIDEAKVAHLAGYLRGRKKLAALMGPAMDRIESVIKTSESDSVATRAALGVAKLVVSQDQGGGSSFLLDDDSKVLWDRLKADEIHVEAEIVGTETKKIGDGNS